MDLKSWQYCCNDFGFRLKTAGNVRANEGLLAMSKKLQKRATKLVRKAEHRVMDIRRAVREYHELQSIAGNNSPGQLRSQLNIEHAVLEYNRVHKALRRVRKKIQTNQIESSRLLAPAPRLIKRNP